jgi:mono/diheme cytochrome c family protein
MHKLLKRILIVLGVLVGLIVLAGVALNILVGVQLNKTYAVPEVVITVPDDEASIARGQHLAEALVGCTDCHGEDLGGGAVFDDPAIALIYAPNLTSGRGGIGDQLDEEELVRALRYGVDHDGRSLLVMPSEAIYNLSDEDLGAIIAYVQRVPSVDRESPETSQTFLGRVLMGLGVFGELRTAELIDFEALRPPAPAPAVVNVDSGKYLVAISGCAICHSENLGGGQSTDPAAPPSPNLTTGGELAGWSQEDFIATIRTGITPEGKELDANFMPWKSLARATDDELSAIWVFLQSLPPVDTSAR